MLPGEVDRVADPMEYIVAEKFQPSLIVKRNGYLAQDMLEEAITRRNQRCWQHREEDLPQGRQNHETMVSWF